MVWAGGEGGREGGAVTSRGALASVGTVASCGATGCGGRALWGRRGLRSGCAVAFSVWSTSAATGATVSTAPRAAIAERDIRGMGTGVRGSGERATPQKGQRLASAKRCREQVVQGTRESMQWNSGTVRFLGIRWHASRCHRTGTEKASGRGLPGRAAPTLSERWHEALPSNSRTQRISWRLLRRCRAWDGVISVGVVRGTE
jgi:hypothetical protein